MHRPGLAEQDVEGLAEHLRDLDEFPVFAVQYFPFAAAVLLRAPQRELGVVLQGLPEELRGVQRSQVVHVHEQGAHVLGEVEVVVLRQLVFLGVQDERLDDGVAPGARLDFLDESLYPLVQLPAFALLSRELAVSKGVVEDDVFAFLQELVLDLQVLPAYQALFLGGAPPNDLQALLVLWPSGWHFHNLLNRLLHWHQLFPHGLDLPYRPKRKPLKFLLGEVGTINSPNSIGEACDLILKLSFPLHCPP